MYYPRNRSDIGDSPNPLGLVQGCRWLLISMDRFYLPYLP